MHKYATGWRENGGGNPKYLHQRKSKKEILLFILCFSIFMALYVIAGTSDAYVITQL